MNSSDRVPATVSDDLLRFLAQRRSEANVASYIAIKSALEYFSIPFGVFTLAKGTPLFRVRVHLEHTGKLNDLVFRNVADLMHRRDVNNILQFGRANEPLQSMFYCSTHPRTAFCETTKTKRTDQEVDVEVSSISEWHVQEDILVATLPSNDLQLADNPLLRDLGLDFEELIERRRGEGTEAWIRVLDVIATEFARDFTSEADYLIPCAFTNYVISNPGRNSETNEMVQADGVMYPSVQWKYEGLNVALHPRLVLSNKIKLERVLCSRMERVSSTHYEDVESLVSSRIDHENQRVHWG